MHKPASDIKNIFDASNHKFLNKFLKLSIKTLERKNLYTFSAKWNIDIYICPVNFFFLHTKAVDRVVTHVAMDSSSLSLVANAFTRTKDLSHQGKNL